MTIRRDDLVAAAAAGLLQYRQVDPLLVFLLQRDVTAKRQAMLEQALPRQYKGVHAVLSFLLAVVALVTAVMFGVLFSSRAVHAMGSGVWGVLVFLYLAGGMAIAAWFRKRGYGARIRLLFAVVMASLPLAVVALQQVSS
jgi:hypothetical protein